ncbi:MAG TPA: hypothetical protein PLT36_06430 [Erysipelotrichaceae bacterium]|nr:hypothetical protein [Erysipelotrichaceae bacterium]HQA85626.1 hypothetical protein [Erysipelotrichaceae bacterium]
MDNNNIYTIKLNANHLAKWMRYLFITLLVSYFFGSFANLIGKIDDVSTFAVVIVLKFIQYCVDLVSAYCLLKLSQVEKIFEKAALLEIIFVVTNIITLFIPEYKMILLPNEILALMMIIPAIFAIYSEYLEHKGFHNLLVGLEDTLAKKWHTLWYIYLVSNVLLLFVGLSALGSMNNIESGLESLLFGTFISAVGVIVHFVYKLVVLNKSAKFFQNMEI